MTTPISDEARKNFARWGEDEVLEMPYWVLEARDGYEAALQAALSRAERAEKALEPFSRLLNEMEKGERRGMPDNYEVYGFNGLAVTLGDFRRARAIVEG